MSITAVECYFIRDGITGRRWSRNRWGTPDSIPDLYATEEGARRQIETGKISVIMRRESFCPEIIEAQLEWN
jgi:hypothetical protein